MSPLRVSANTVAIGNVRAEVDAASPASTLTEFVSFMRDYTSVSKASGVKDDCVYYKDARYSNYFDYYQAFAEDLYPDEHDESNLSYENLMRGIRVMRGVNAAREEQGLPALKVSPMLMAGQIVEVDVNDGTTGDVVRHSNMRSANGNLAWGSSPEGVARVWMSEKDEYDRFVAADPAKAVKGVQGATSGYDTLYDFYINNLEEYQKVGHYLTIVDPSNRSMGAFYSEDASGWSASAKTGTSDLTVDQFERVVRNAMVDAEPSDTDVSRASVDAIPDQTFTGSPLEPRPAVRLGGRTLSEGTDYALSFGGNEGIGTATVTVTGKGAYTGAKSVTFRIGFSDVPAGHWVLTGDVDGEGYLAAVVRMGLMTGYGDPATGRLTGRFGPEDSVTRAQVVTVLYRRANPGSTDTTTGAHAENATSLSDNESGQYYTAAVNWAVRTGVVTGYTAGPDAGRFVPDREISREELATMVHRFAALEGASDSVPDSAYGGAPDAGDSRRGTGDGSDVDTVVCTLRALRPRRTHGAGMQSRPNEGAEKPVFSPVGAGLRRDSHDPGVRRRIVRRTSPGRSRPRFGHRVSVRDARGRRQYSTPGAAAADRPPGAYLTSEVLASAAPVSPTHPTIS